MHFIVLKLELLLFIGSAHELGEGGRSWLEGAVADAEIAE